MREIVPDQILDRKYIIGLATPEKSWLSKMCSWVGDILQKGVDTHCLEMTELKNEQHEVTSGNRRFSNYCRRRLNFIALEEAR